MQENREQEFELGDRGLVKRQSFLLHPGESPEVDYKDAVALKSGEPFALKLVKHILGMCNAGGGFIIIGFKENDVNKHPEAVEIDDSIAASYDLSSLASLVERYTEGSDKIDLIVHKDAHPTTGIIYPIIEIRGFKKHPFFCKSTTKGILENGALYIRVASARTIKVASPDEWEQLINQCVEKRQDELLSRFTSLLKEVGLPHNLSSIPDIEIDDKKEWTEQNRKELNFITKKVNSLFEGLEFEHCLINSEKKANLKQLLDVAEKAKRTNTGWPIGLVVHAPEDKPTADNDSITCRIADQSRIDYWRIKTNGNYYFFRKFEEDQPRFNKEGDRVMWFDVRIWRVAELIDHTVAFHKAFGTDPTSKIKLTVRHLGIKGRQLTASDPMRAFTMHTRSANAENAEWSRELSLDLLKAERNAIIAEICKELFMLFDFWEPADSVISGVIEKYDGAGR